MKKAALVLLVILTIFLTACDQGASTTQKQKEPTPVKVQSTPKPKPPKREITYKSAQETERVAFEEQRIQDPNLLKGQTAVRQEGADGLRTKTFKLTLKNGEEQSRVLETDEITIAPVPKIIAEGTKEPPPPAPAPAPAPAPPASGQTVYGTNTGARYHQDHGHVGGCHSYLRSSKIAMTISQAQAQGLTPCQCGSCSW